MRTKELLSVLDKKEKKEFESRLIKHSRYSLFKLYTEIVQNQSATKESMYYAFTHKTYQKQYDYLLRNELRLLSEEIELFIVETEAKIRLAKNDFSVRMWLLDKLLLNEQYHAFELEWKELLKSAEQKADISRIYQLLKIYSDFRLQSAEINPDEVVFHLDIINTKTEALRLFYDLENSENEIRKQFLIANQKALNETSKALKKNFILPVPEIKDIQKYNQLKAKSYLSTGKKKINLLNQLISLYPKTAPYCNYSIYEISNLYGNIGLEYFLQSNYIKADDYYKKAIEADSPTQPNLSLLYNYAINNMMIKNYHIIQGIYYKYKYLIEQSEKVKHRFKHFTVISLLFQDSPEEAFNLLENEFSKRPKYEYYYYRMVYAMVYFDMKEYQLAERELYNILQSLRRNKTLTYPNTPLIHLFYKFIQTIQTKGFESMYSENIEKISEALNELEKQNNNFSVIILEWLKIRIVQQHQNIHSKLKT